jgi:hypothetical protein
MLYYWQTKYTTSIYRPFFIFPHNRHFFVHISPRVLGVPFQPSEDTDALLSELPPLSQNVVHAADPSQSEKMEVGGCQIRAIGGVWKNFPPHLCNCFRCEASGVGASLKTQLFTSQLFSTLLYCWTLFCNHFAWTPQKTQPILLRRRIYWFVA